MTNPQMDEITKIVQGLTVRETQEPLLHVTRTDIQSLLTSARQEAKREVLKALRGYVINRWIDNETNVDEFEKYLNDIKSETLPGKEEEGL